VRGAGKRCLPVFSAGLGAAAIGRRGVK